MYSKMRRVCSIPARALLGVYAAFLLFYFVPWNLKNADEASALETSLQENYGTISTEDEIGIALTQLSAVACALFSLISVYKCGVIIFASNRHTNNIWLYPLSVILSIALSVMAHERYSYQMLHSLDSVYLFAQPLLALFRGLILYKIMYTQAKKKIAANEAKKDALAKKTDSDQAVAPSLISSLMTFSSKVGFVMYWLVYIFVGSFFYNEMVTYIVEEHIKMSTFTSFMKFVLV